MVLDYRTVCHMTSSPVTLSWFRRELKTFYLDSRSLQFCFSSFLCGPCGFHLGHGQRTSILHWLDRPIENGLVLVMFGENWG